MKKLLLILSAVLLFAVMSACAADSISTNTTEAPVLLDAQNTETPITALPPTQTPMDTATPTPQQVSPSPVPSPTSKPATATPTSSPLPTQKPQTATPKPTKTESPSVATQKPTAVPATIAPATAQPATAQPATPTPTIEVTPLPTPIPTEQPAADPNDSIMVWQSATGKSYHDVNNCGKMNPDKAKQLTLSEAKRKGLDWCDTCQPPR